MSDTDDDFGEAGSLNSDSDMESDADQGIDDEPHSGDEDMPEIGEVVEDDQDQQDDEEVHALMSQNIKVETEKPKSSNKHEAEPKKTRVRKPQLSKKALSTCAVPGCKSRFLLTIGVKISSFQVPQPTDPKYSNVWLKWLHALGYSSSEEDSKACSSWARVCELHFTDDCFVKDWECEVLGKKPRTSKKLASGSYPTLNVPVPEEVLEDPRLLFHLDPVIGERAENLASKKNPSSKSKATKTAAASDPTSISEAEKADLKARIMEEAETRVRQELSKPTKSSVIPESLANLNKGLYEKKVRQLIASSGIQSRPPSFIDSLYRKLGIPKEPSNPLPKPVFAKPAPPPPLPASSLPPCTILRPVAKEGEPPLPAIVLPGVDNAKAIKLLEDPNIQALLKTMAEKHRAEMAKKMAEEGDEEEEEYVTESGEKASRIRKKVIPPPPMIILQATDTSTPGTSAPSTESADIVQMAIDKTFNVTQQKTKPVKSARSKASVKWAHQKFLETLPPIDSKLLLNDEGNIVKASAFDHDYGQAEELSGIPIFDPTGLRQEVEQWRQEVENLRKKNYELKIRLSEGRFNRKSAQSSMRIGFKSVQIDRKKLEKLEISNRKLQEELILLKLERRRMLNKERNRKRKRKKVLERRQKRRDWIMEQIELGNMTKEHLELVYSRKKLPYEKKSGSSNETMTLVTLPDNIRHQPQQIHVQIEEDGTQSNTRQTVVSGTKPRRGRQPGNRNPQNLDGMTSVVVTTSDVQHHEINDENVVAVSGIPGVVISSGGMHSGAHQIIVEGGTGEEYTHEQIDFIVKAVDDMEAQGWKVASPRHYQRQHY